MVLLEKSEFKNGIFSLEKKYYSNSEQSPEYCGLQNVERLIINDYWVLKQWH